VLPGALLLGALPAHGRHARLPREARRARRTDARAGSGSVSTAVRRVRSRATGVPTALPVVCGWRLPVSSRRSFVPAPARRWPGRRPRAAGRGRSACTATRRRRRPLAAGPRRAGHRIRSGIRRGRAAPIVAPRSQGAAGAARGRGVVRQGEAAAGRPLLRGRPRGLGGRLRGLARPAGPTTRVCRSTRRCSRRPACPGRAKEE
jgi:hypothetical protein